MGAGKAEGQSVPKKHPFPAGKGWCSGLMVSALPLRRPEWVPLLLPSAQAAQWELLLVAVAK